MKLSRTMREALEELRKAGESVDEDEIGLRGATRPTLAALERRGLARSSWRRVAGRVWGVTLWELTAAGRAELSGE